jgi:phosphoenolpyruvate-protein phosphotransferase (PTS system enzyme I)
MKTLAGVGASSGVAIGPVVLVPPRVEVPERQIDLERVAAELRRLDTAVDTADAQLSTATDAFVPDERTGNFGFVELQRSLLRFDLAGEAGRVVREQHVGAEWAVRVVVREMGRLFAESSDAGTPAGLDDFAAVADRLLRVLLRLPERRLDATALRDGVAIAVELSPLDVLQLKRAGVAGIATERGGPTSHAAIVARDVGIPYVFAVPGLLLSAGPGAMICLDGKRGSMVVSPDALTLEQYQGRRERWRSRRLNVGLATPGPICTVDGVPVSLGANVDTPEGVSAAVSMGAENIGLVRTELLYLDRDELPTEEQQYEDAVRILEAAQGRTVTFRTLDLGGDKLPASVEFSPGPNAALGLRAVRFSLRRRDIFRAQLRALLRAAALGPARIMFPMVTGVNELREAVRFCRDVAVELDHEGLARGASVPVGTMVETPSAAVTADQLAAACDFLSLGTNDLIQYAFAADRQNDDVRYLYHPLHPGALRLMQYAITAAGRLGKTVAVCGDVAGDPSLTWVLLGLGIRELSMPAAQIDTIRTVIRGTSIEAAQHLADSALASRSEIESEALVESAMRARFPSGPEEDDAWPATIAGQPA